MMTKEEMFIYDQMVEMGIATSEEINLVRNVLDGSWLYILDAILYARTGYRTWEQFIEEEMEE